MCPQLPSSRQQLRSRAPLGARSFSLIGLASLVVISYCIGSFVGAGEELSIETGRRLSANEPTTICPVSNASDLYRCVSQASASDWVKLNLPPGILVLDQTLSIPVSATLQGAQITDNGPGTTLSCGGTPLASLIEFSGSHLHLVGVQLQDCNTTGLRIMSEMDVDVTIQHCVFQNFTRVLGSDRVDLLAEGLPAPWTPSTAALALHAGNFSGSLTVVSTQFRSNSFSTQAIDRRRLHDDAWGDHYHVPLRRVARQHQQQTRASATMAWGQFLWQSTRRRRLPSVAMQAYSWADAMSLWGGSADDSTAAFHRRRVMATDDSSTTSYTPALLKMANQIHPGVQVGPWADDMEAVFSVLCGWSKTCKISLQNSTFDSNTGVATGAVYVLCDGSTSCHVNLTDTSVTNNHALWQKSKQLVDPDDDAPPPPPPPPPEQSDAPEAPPSAPGEDASPPESSGSFLPPPLPSGIQRLQRIAPWLTYLYPLLYFYSLPAVDQLTSVPAYAEAMDPTIYPSITGRTLGAVVLHQRRSPAVGVSPSAASAMMTVRVSGGTFSGNDGAAIMSTATDFMDLAGGNGTWSGAPPRHSADFSMSGMRVDDHGSGWPAVWIRWARKVAINGIKVKNSSGGVWLDEVRDSAVVEDSNFIATTPAHTWLDYLGFGAPTPDGWDIGLDTSQVVKIQMTPLGKVPNFATVRGCHFEGNPAYSSGVLSIRGADVPDFDDADDQPGSTEVLVDNTTFVSNTCGWPPGAACDTPARPLRISCVFNATVQQSRFLGNLIGGLDCRRIHNLVLTDSEFDGNQMTFLQDDSRFSDRSVGGGAFYAQDMGTDSTGGITIKATNFTRNQAGLGGGALYIRNFGPLEISSGCRFENNKANTYDGGAIWLYVSNAESRIDTAFFSGNSAGRNGGAISVLDLVATGSTTGLYLKSCVFNGNEALLNPSTRGRSIVDQAGGGAVFAKGTSIHAESSEFTANTVFGHAGGAIRVVDTDTAWMVMCNFTNNAAIMGGAVALSRLSNQGDFYQCSFTNNTVVDPRVWKATLGQQALENIDPGYGGAVYAIAVNLVSVTLSVCFSDNSAKFGGAIAALSSARFLMSTSDYSTLLPYFYAPVPSNVIKAAGVALPGRPSHLPSRFLFSNNTALIGGALYMYSIQSMDVDFYKGMLQYELRSDPTNPTIPVLVETEESKLVSEQPAALFIYNTANGGGAAYFEGNGAITFSGFRFVANRALVPPLEANYSGLYGQEKYYGTAKALPCYNGGGGAVCVVGQADTTFSVASSDMIANKAKDGAGMFIAEGLDCIEQSGCYAVTLNAVNMSDNSATSRGGSVFWMHAGVLSIASCPTDREYTFEVGIYNTSTVGSLSPGSADNPNSGNLVSLRAPVRKAPAKWYKQMTRANQDILLAHIGGPARLTASSPVHAINGEVQMAAGRVVFAATVEAGATEQSSDNRTVAAAGAYLNMSSGTVVAQLGSTSGGNRGSSEEQLSLLSVGSLPIVLTDSVLLDPSWLGVPYDQLPCGNWRDNTADTGHDIATTPYFLLSPSRLDFYTSNTDIEINVTVHDWLGYPCTGGSDAQPPVLVQAQSREVSGAVTATVQDGTAVFTALKLRAQQGLHNVSMIGRSQAPSRELLSSQLTINVRPCTINEFLSPKNFDECIPCDLGSFNLNVSAVSCQSCPDNAMCGYPDPAACKLGRDCDPVGYMVPNDGHWHSNFFSDEVIECTNKDACTTPNRSSVLSQMQLQIWKVARQLQQDASTIVADAAARAAMAQLLSSPMARRLQAMAGSNKALQDDVYSLLVLNATADMMPEYMQSQCAEGYTGTLCGECAEGYGWRRIATCGKCPPTELNNLYYALVTLLTLSLLAFTVYSSLKEQRRPGRLVGGPTAPTDDKASRTSKAAKVNPSAGVLGVQASGPSQFHVILAAAAAEDAAAEAAPALALLRDCERSRSPLGDVADGSPYEYVDPVLAAARNQFASVPGTPKGRPGSPAPFPIFDTAVRSHSVLGVPSRASRWAGLDDGRYATASFTRANVATLRPTAQVEDPGASALPSGGGGATAAGGTAAAAPTAGTGGPVAEGVLSGYDNALYEGTRAGAGGDTEILPADETETELEGEVATTERAVRLSTAGRPVAESKDYTNVLYEEPRTAEAQSADGVVVAATTSPRGPQAPLLPAPAASAPVAAATSNQQDIGTGPAAGAGGITVDVDPAPDTCVSARSRLVPPPGVMLQSVPILATSPPRTPPRTPLHYASNTSVPPVVLELPTVAERTRPGEIPKRGAVVGRERAHQSTVVKIFVSYVQVLALLQNVPLRIPGVVDMYYRINNQAISYPGILVSLDCSLPQSSVSKAFVRVILTVLAPLYIFAGAVVWFLLFNALDFYVISPWYAKHPSKKNRKRHLPMPTFAIHLEVYLARQLIVTFIAIFFFFYPSVVQSLMTIFNCQDVNVVTTENPLANGLGLVEERIWSQDYGLQCYEGSHLALVLGLGVPGVILIAIGWPLMSALFMSGKLICMNNIRITEDMTSFFLADFKARFAWWESVIMMRKLFIAVIVTLVDGNNLAGMQLLLVICILVIAAGIHLLAMPYHHAYTNNLELMSLGTLLATLYFSLYFGFSSSISNGGRVAISILILVVNITMVIIFIYYIVQAYFYAALCKTGLSSLDSETRRKLTAAELQQRIFENLTAQGSNASFNQETQQQPPIGDRQRTSYQRVASLYAAAVWASMRVGSTTNKMMTRVRTLLRDDPNASHPTSREGSITEIEGVPLPRDGDGGADGRETKTGKSVDGDAIDDDPEAARSSAAVRKRAVSGPGIGVAATATATLHERTSLSKPPPAGMEAPNRDRHSHSRSLSNSNSGQSRSQSQSSPGTAPTGGSQASSTIAPRPPARSSNHHHRDEAVQSVASRNAPSMVSRVSSTASLENPSLPPFPMEHDAATAAVDPIAAAVVTSQPPQAAPPPAIIASPLASPRGPANNVRSQSRLAHTTGQADRSGELLPPPPSFPGRGGATKS